MNAAWNASRQTFFWPVLGKEAFEQLNPIEFRDGVAKAAALSEGASITRPELALLVQGKMYPELQCVGAWVEIGGNEFEQLLSAVRNRVLDFALKIESENPNFGEAPPNTHPIPEDRPQPLVQNFFGPVGNLAQNSHSFTQAASIGISVDDLTRLVVELRDNLGELALGEDDRRNVQAQLDTLNAQLEADPNPVIIREAGRTLRNLTEGAIAGLITTAAQPTVWAWIHAALAHF